MLGAAGLLEGKRATGHWLYLEPLRGYGADPVGGRFVEDGKVVTAAGVSAGIDMALHLVGREVSPEVAQAVQLGIEYDPQPPFDAGSPQKAPQEIVELVTAIDDPGLGPGRNGGSPDDLAGDAPERVPGRLRPEPRAAAEEARGVAEVAVAARASFQENQKTCLRLSRPRLPSR